jgi:hypothetical protein
MAEQSDARKQYEDGLKERGLKGRLVDPPELIHVESDAANWFGVDTSGRVWRRGLRADHWEEVGTNYGFYVVDRRG